MTALLLEAPGSPADLAPTTVASPERSAEEVVVEVHAAAINPSDVLNCLGLPITTYPRVPGRDFAGVVVEGPDELLGERVWGTGSGDLGFTRHGSHAERLALPAAGVVRCPDRFTTEQAGASGLAYATAAAGLARGGLRAGIDVLVTGAAGGVGSAASAISGWRDARVIAAVKDEAERDAVEQAMPGAAVVMTGAGSLAARVRDLTDGRGVDLAYDTVGNVLFEEVIAALAEDGAMIVISAKPQTAVELDLSQFYRRRLGLLGVSSTISDATWTASLLAELLPGFESGELPPVRIDRALPLAAAADGYAQVAQGAAAGRVVLTPSSC
jgi:NADPH:quinone reductase-like Zn-dependent oxidoreductase